MENIFDHPIYKGIIKWWISIRWFIIIILFSIGILKIQSPKSYILILFVLVFLGNIVLNLFFQSQLKNRKQFYCVLQIILDIIFATMLVFLTGGLNSLFTWSYLIAIITASLTVEKWGGLLTSFLSSSALVIVQFFFQLNIISFSSENLTLDKTLIAIYVLSYTGLFVGVAFITDYIFLLILKMLEKENIDKKKINELNEIIAKKNDTIDQCQSEILNYSSVYEILSDISHLDNEINTPLCIISLSLSRVKKAAAVLNNEQLEKSGNEITSAVNDITQLLKRLKSLKEKINEKDVMPRKEL